MRHTAAPVTPDAACVARGVVLDGRPLIRVTHHGYHVGDFPDVAAVAAHGVNLALLTIREDPA